MLLDDEGDGEAARGPGKPNLSLTRLRDFLMEKEVKECLHRRELYALIHLIFSDTNIQVYLHEKYYLSIG